MFLTRFHTKTRLALQNVWAELTTKALLSATVLSLILSGTTMISMTNLANAAPQSTKQQSSSRVSQFVLGNGMQVLVIPDHRAPVVTHMVWYHVGAADEPPGKAGVAHFLEHLMFKGTEKIAPAEFSKIIARNGGRDNAFTSQDATVYHQRVASDRLPLVMKLEADRMRNLKLDDKTVRTERDVVLEERRSRTDNSPSAILSEQMMAALYVSHPYGAPVIGWEHEIKALNLKDAMEFYRQFYAPNNAILIVAGDVTRAQVEKLAKATYGKIERVEAVKMQPRPQEAPPAAPRRVILKDKRAGKASFSRLYLVPSYNTARQGEAEAIDLMMKILAGGSTSLMYNDLVVDDKIATSVSGWYESSGRDYGRIGFHALAAGKNSIRDVEKALDKEIAKFIKNGPTQKQLERAKNSYIAEYVYGVDSQSTLARRYGWALVVGQSVKDVEEWPKRLEKVTTKDISRVAAKYLVEKASVTGLLFPVEKTKQARKTTLRKRRKRS